MTVLQFAPRVAVEAEDLIDEARREAFKEGMGKGLAEGYQIGLDMPLAVVPEDFYRALRYGSPGTVCRIGGVAMVLAKRGTGQDTAAEVLAWTRVFEIRQRIRDEAGPGDMPVMRRTELPEQIAGLIWREGDHEVIVVSLTADRRALVAELRGAGHTPLHQTRTGPQRGA